MKSPSITRRRFLQTTGATLAAPTILPSSIFGKTATAPSNQVTLGIIGLGGNGLGALKNFLTREDARVVALCDVDREHHRDKTKGKGPAYGLDPGKALVAKAYDSPKGCDTYTDFRELCARDDIDAIVVSTPDHWHALMTLEALRAGKDVYCEKPVTHLFAEGQAVYNEVAKRDAIFQVGSQQRSDIRFRIAAEAVRNGHIGKVHTVEIGFSSGHMEPPVQPAKPTAPPGDLDYDLWCGPSEKLPYIFARHHRNWRWHLSYGGGQIMDWIGHHNDIAHWGLGMDKSGPEEVEAVGWTWPTTEIYNTPVNYEIRSRYEDGFTTSISDKHTIGIKWIGEDGWVFVARGKIDASNREFLQEKFDRGPEKLYLSLDHRGNFLEGVRTRKKCVAPAETGHRSVTPGHLAYVSNATGAPVQWDPKTETIPNNPEADQLLKTVDYRKPWAL